MSTLFTLSCGARPRFRRSVYPARRCHAAAVVTGGAVTLPRFAYQLRELARSLRIPGRSKARRKADLERLLLAWFRAHPAA